MPVGYDPDAPWPTMRHDYRNTGRADGIKPSLMSDLEQVPLWTFSTDGPVFFTPSIGPDGTVYMGSADFCFYAVSPEGRLKWKRRTGRYVVGGPAVSAEGTVYLPGADGYVHAFDSSDGREIWRFASRNVKPDRVEMVGWFEGNITMTPDGTVLAPCDDFCVYGLRPDGSLEFEARSGGMVWSAVPTDSEGRHFFGSLDCCCYGVDSGGERLWRKRTLGVIAGSPALGRDGTVYIPSHDGKVYALDADTGKKKWSFKTGDFICGSVAVGTEDVLYVGGGDGNLYALVDRGDRVELLWRYHTLEPIRCSPVLDGDGDVYFANGEGKVFVLDVNGRRRWSYDLSDTDISDINGSIALGRKAFYLGMQDGRIVQVPYRFGLREEVNRDPRCSTEPGDDLPRGGAFVYWVTPGGRSVSLSCEAGSARERPEILPANVITMRLLVRKEGETVVSGIGKLGLHVGMEPDLPHRVSVSIDRRYLNIVPEVPMSPGTDYRVTVRGLYRRPLVRIMSNIWLLAGRRVGRFCAEMTFRTPGLGTGGEREGRPLVVYDMSLYQPVIFAGLAQIGMDDIKLIISPVERLSRDRWVGWAMLAWPDGEGGFRVHHGNRVTMPVIISYHGDLVFIESRDVAFDQGGDRFGLRLLRMSGKPGEPFTDKGISRNSLYAEGRSLSMAGFIYGLPLLGAPLCGTFKMDYVRIPTEAPPGFDVRRVYAEDRKVVAEYSNGAGVQTSEHHFGILVLNRKTKEPVRLDYPKCTSIASDPGGRVLATEIRIPRSIWPRIKGNTRAVVIIDGIVLQKADL